MALPHALPGQVVDILPPGDGPPVQQSTALFKARDLEVIRLVLRAGKSLPPHKVPGEVTIQCIDGALSVSAEGQVHLLKRGQLLYLQGDVVHSALAVEDAQALVTIALGA